MLLTRALKCEIHLLEMSSIVIVVNISQKQMKRRVNKKVSFLIFYISTFLYVHYPDLYGNSVLVATTYIKLSSKASLKEWDIIKTEKFWRLFLQNILLVNFLHRSRSNNNSLKSPFVPEL
jgi:hypothetical protein